MKARDGLWGRMKLNIPLIDLLELKFVQGKHHGIKNVQNEMLLGQFQTLELHGINNNIFFKYDGTRKTNDASIYI